MTTFTSSFYGAIVLGITFCLQACAPLSYTAGPTYATVVDGETKQPVPGAVVVAQWVLEGGMHRDRTGVLIVREAVTDAAGAFRIDGWGPLSRPSEGALDRWDPEIIVFKSGYQTWIDSNQRLPGP